jgi:hypothetical protein
VGIGEKRRRQTKLGRGNDNDLNISKYLLRIELYYEVSNSIPASPSLSNSAVDVTPSNAAPPQTLGRLQGMSMQTPTIQMPAFNFSANGGAKEGQHNMGSSRKSGEGKNGGAKEGQHNMGSSRKSGREFKLGIEMETGYASSKYFLQCKIEHCDFTTVAVQNENKLKIPPSRRVS